MKLSKPLTVAQLATALFFLTSAPLCAQTSELIWSDEFDGPAGILPDSARWAYDLGGGGWGNRELQVYTNSTQNVFLDGSGNLVIRAVRATNGTYTSARLVTREKFEPQFGRIEARIKLPYGQGIWPAFWMLGNDIRLVGWPTCGEVDIMENIGREPSTVHASMHGPGYSGATPISRQYTLPNGEAFSENFHTFAIEWFQDSVRFFVDGNLFYAVTPADLPGGKSWVFNKPFFLLLNLAVGGSWPGNPDGTTVFPQTMTIDYIRVFKSADAPRLRRRP
ncbi:MAG TPA: glycoside hydrolase family 16 protein [Acidobacteriota bacterium]|jgi:beta-glucanase (GH16 family)